MSAQVDYSANAYANSRSDEQTSGRKVSDVEQELAILSKNAEALTICVEQLEKRLGCVLPPAIAQTNGSSQPEVVRVPLANIIRGANNRLHGSITHLNDIIARVELPE